jgi:hypothetical protein
MGHRCRWIATRDDGQALLSLLKLERKGRSEGPVYEPGLLGVQMPSGWYVTVGDGRGYMDEVREEHAVAVSQGGEALFYYLNGGDTEARLGHYVGGQLAWSLEYGKMADRPHQTGTVPLEIAQPLAQAVEEAHEPDGVHFGKLCDSIGEAGFQLTGFRLWTTLVSTADDAPPIDLLASAKKSLWARFFGSFSPPVF